MTHIYRYDMENRLVEVMHDGALLVFGKGLGFVHAVDHEEAEPFPSNDWVSIALLISMAWVLFLRSVLF
ncbi:MAG: hypothetical protein EOM20_05120 [Spartobacteria bacterium]|nr:hypothetical protein [Spartobacteria bacterium]